MLFLGQAIGQHVYIDGSNLYFGLLHGTPDKWLDLERFCEEMLPRNTVRKIYYFIAKVDAHPHDPDQSTRQLAYLNASATLPRVEVHLGAFMTSVATKSSSMLTPRLTVTYGRAANLSSSWMLRVLKKKLVLQASGKGI